MNIVTVLIISYVIQIGLGAYGYLNMQVRTVQEQKLRRTVLIFALLPCMYASVIIQVVAIAMYRYRGARDEEASSRLKSSFSSDDSRPRQSGARAPENPFDTGDDTTGPSTASGLSPLGPGDGDETATQTPPSDNPFG